MMKSRKRNAHNSYRVLQLLLVCLFLSSCAQTRSVNNFASNSDHAPAVDAVNINTASAEDLMAIPYIGEKIAARIVRHREVNGPFRRTEDLLLIDGISDKRFRSIRSYIRAN